MSLQGQSKSDYLNLITITTQIRDDEMQLNYQWPYFDERCLLNHLSLLQEDKLLVLINFILKRINQMYHSQVVNDTKVSYTFTKSSALKPHFAILKKLISPCLSDNQTKIVEVFNDNKDLDFKNEPIVFSNRQAILNKMTIKTINNNKNISPHQLGNVSVTKLRLKRDVNASLHSIVQSFVNYSTNWCTENETQLSELMLNNPSDILSMTLKKLNLDQLSQKEKLTLASPKGYDASLVISQSNANELKRLNCIKSNKDNCSQVCLSFGHILKNAVQLETAENEKLVSPLLTMMALDSSSGNHVATTSLKNHIKVAVPLNDPWKMEDLEVIITRIFNCTLINLFILLKVRHF